MKIKLLFISLTSSLLFVTNISAADMPIAFEELDQDASGYISSDEAKARDDLVQNFKEIDSDNNGKLNIDEYQAYEGQGLNEPPEDSETSELGAAPYE